MHSDTSLPPVWVIGFTGHRHLQAVDKVANAIRQVMESLRRDIKGELMGYSSLAIGADTLFAETCLALNIPWSAILPRPESDFKHDFSEADWQRASALLKQAAHVECLSVGMKDHETGYLECGLTTVEEADVVVAVWDGKAPRGMGGTADMVAHARTLAKPLLLLDSDTIQLTRERFSPDVFRDEEMNYLNCVPDYFRSGAVDDPKGRVLSFFRKVDRHAARIAPRFRGWIGASVLMNAVASILTTAAVTLALTSNLLNGIVFVLVAAATISVGLIKRQKAHRKWIQCRVAAEICRSCLATWELAEFPTPFWFQKLKGFSRLAKSIRLLRLMDTKKPAVDFEDVRSEYLKVRVEKQLDYLCRRCRRLRFTLAVCNGCFWTFSAIALGRTFFSMFFFKSGQGTATWETVNSFLPIALPLAAGCALSLVSIFDLNRQLARSKEMAALLNSLRQRLEDCHNLISFRHAVEHAEDAFAFEVFEWFILHKYPRFS